MRQFFRYLGALTKHLKGVVAALVGSVVFASPSWIRPALTPDWQKWMDSLLTLDANMVRKAYLIFLPFGIFWATYRAWQEENSRRLAAEKATPEELKNDVQTLTEQLAEARNILASRWQSLSDQQRADFVQELKQFDIKTARPQPNVLIFPDFTHHDAVELSHTMSWLFAQADWNAPTLSSGRNPVDCPPGITIHATAERLGLQAITKALGRANIPYELKPEVIREAIAMYIGRRNP